MIIFLYAMIGSLILLSFVIWKIEDTDDNVIWCKNSGGIPVVSSEVNHVICIKSEAVIQQN
ncbi:MAG: hypothetical protein ACOCWG_06220 [bacterium]